MRIALYPGTFDPVTNGHLDVINRASKLFDKVIITVAKNEPKNPAFTLSERRALIEPNVASISNIEVKEFDGLVIDYAKSQGAIALIRGLRAVSDFEYELQMGQMNRNLDDNIETLFLLPNEAYTFISSSMIKQVAAYGGDISRFVPENVYSALKEKYPKLRENKIT